MNRRVPIAALLLALGLYGCASNNKDFEKEIWGQQAPESPSDTGWPRQSATPPPPPPPPAYTPAPYAPPPPPAPVASRPLPAQGTPTAAAPAAPPMAASGGTGRPIAPPVVEPAPTVTDPRFAPKPFKPGPAEGEQAAAPQGGYAAAPGAATSPAAAPATAPPAALRPAPMPEPAGPASEEPAGAPSDRATFTFMAGSFAHKEKASELMNTLESRGFSTRIDQGKLNNKTFFKVYAVKEGNRAELEGELFAAGVTEPHLTEERPLDRGGAAKTGAAGSAKTAPAATGTAKAPSPKPSGNIPPPIVEPAPPLPDGYVPPPPKAGGS